MPNRLAAEPSPYLLQHAHNPVDWYPWGDEAFARARAEQKPIFLSIGYSTCHWCHVMEHESFEDPEIAELLNAHFISVKVDREERPDVDRVYMTFVQATTGSGGWPMSVWLTPDLQPFYGGTYFPPRAQWGRPGFSDVLREIARVWHDERDEVVRSAGDVVRRLGEMVASGSAAPGVPGEEALAATVRQFAQAFDPRRGGFGEQPKFPRPTELLFLLREHARTGDETAREMVLVTLRAMALGGMRDHIGGGFHRYAVDRDWRVPHFEKMLYDQAQLVLAYLEAAQASGDRFFAEVAEDTLQYVERDLADPAGGFHSAEDADSVPPGAEPGARKTEGAFYIWGVDELREALGDDSRAFERRYGVLPDGNAPFDPQDEFGTKNLLYTARGIGEIAAETGQTPEAVAAALERARQRLFSLRATRPRPHLDDKVLTAWNGLMIAAFARASRVLEAVLGGDIEARRHLRTAERAAGFLREVMWDAERRVLLRRYRQGRAAIDGYAEDYASAAFGMIELFQAGGDVRWLDWGVELLDRLDALFADPAGGWFSTTGDDPSVLLRMKEEYDGAEPSPGSLAAVGLLALAHLTGERRFRERADAAIASYGQRLTAHGRVVPLMAAALSTAHAPVEQVVIAGHPGAPDTAALWHALHRRYRPFTLVVPLAPGEPQARLADRLPWVASMTMREGRATAYVCRGFACEAPVTDPEAL